jgi:hypothetical protein
MIAEELNKDIEIVRQILTADLNSKCVYQSGCNASAHKKISDRQFLAAKHIATLEHAPYPTWLLYFHKTETFPQRNPLLVIWRYL